MRFGKTLKNSVYPPWSGKYIDYHKLKVLLKEHDATEVDASDSEDSPWTEEDEEAFVQELINVQLDKVNAFQVETSQKLKERTSACESRLLPLAPNADQETAPAIVDEKEKKTIASEILQELDQVAKEVSELQKYSRINFTGFLKAAKKHDRKRGARYRVRPLLQVRLSQLPFNSEDYSPLVHRLSVMYSFARQILSEGAVEVGDAGETRFGHDTYSYKFWVHEDNILEVKTYILRRLPVLIYNPKSSRDFESLPEDPTITSLYFDNSQFDLYTQKVAKAPEAGSLRLRWTGNLKDTPAIFLEKKIVTSDDHSKEVRVQLKEKHVQEFLEGRYAFEKQLHRMEGLNNGESAEAEALKKDVEELQSFIRENSLQPMLRANYTRTAFQIPGDDRIRISLDTNLALIREDALDEERPCREPTDWHRRDIDDSGMQYPFSGIRTGEVNRFPHALLEIKLRGSAHNAEWVNDLMVSHLVKEAPRFSKFVHGVAQLFEDYVNSFPFWLSELENDIRRDPETAFQEEQERLAKRAEDDMVVGSFLGGSRASPAVRPLGGSPVTMFSDLGAPARTRQPSQAVPRPSRPSIPAIPEGEGRTLPDVKPQEETQPMTSSRFAALFPSLPISRSSRTHRQSVVLPPGVREPVTWIKDSGPVRVESKVYLANQRTFIKWLHVSILLSSLSLGLYNAAGKHNDIARALAVVYTFFALFSAAWGWYMYEMRSRLIRQRSGRDLDNMFGPIVVCIGLAIALVLNFAFKYSSTMKRIRGEQPIVDTPSMFNVSFTPVEQANTWQLVNQGGQGL